MKIFFYDKKYVEFNLLNDIDLPMIDCQNYHKEYSNLNIYKCFNEKNNLIPKLIEEVIATYKNLTDWGQSWWQDIENYELHYEFDREFISTIDNGTVIYPELLNKVKTVIWRDIKSRKSSRCIIFSREGYVKFYKDSKKNGINYEFSYNVLSDGFKFKGNINGEDLTINDNKYFTEIKTKQSKIVQTKENSLKYIDYVSPIIDNFSVSMNIWMNELNEIEKCNIFFKTHKGNGKINGMYILKLNPSNMDKCLIKFIGRKRNFDFTINLFEANEISKFEGKITIEMINEIVNKVIPIINKKEEFPKNQIIFEDLDILTQEKQIINFLKQLKDEIPLPLLKERVEEFAFKSEQGKKLYYNIQKEK